MTLKTLLLIIFSFLAGVLFSFLIKFQKEKITLEKEKTALKEKEIALKRKERHFFEKKEEIEKEFAEKERDLKEKEKEILEKKKQLLEKERKIQEKEKEIERKLEEIARLNKEEAKEKIFAEIEKEYQKQILEWSLKLEKEKEEKYLKRAREILVSAMQRLTLPVVQETTTTNYFLPNVEFRGKIIGKEGRNIRTFEKLTGVELILDEETPELVIISCFDPVRREIAKIALDKLIKDGRIQPAKIEEKVKEAEKEIEEEIKKAGEETLSELGIVGIDPNLVKILGRLKFRSSFGQNVLQHSLEVAFLAQMIASEVGADQKVAKIAGLFHDIGKAIDHQVEGSHVQIGMKILEKFGMDKKIISAMKSHHGEFPPESVEAVIVQIADQISGARPGARKETVQEYVKRLEDLEKIALSFHGVEKAFAVEGGRELRVLVKANEVDDFEAQKIAKEIARRIEEEVKYPGIIKVQVIREFRVIEYAK
jgi:ribonuclease Y